MKKFSLLLLTLLLASNLAAEIVTKNIVYKIDDEEFTGYLAYDDSSKEKRPGVLVVHAWWGLGDYEKRRTRMLAELGYVAFAADMYGTGKHTDKPDQARNWMQEVTTDVEWWRERTQKGIDVLKQQKYVDVNNIAAIGYCFGGGSVLQLAYSGSDINGVVSFHGSLPKPEPEVKGKIKANILVAHGNDDDFVPPAMVSTFQQALEDMDAPWQMISYGNVKHSFTNPTSDTRGMSALKYDAYADKHSWRAMQNFFEDIFN